jgi:predicted transcriptional regulator
MRCYCRAGAVSALLRLKRLGFGTRRIARTLGISRNTVKSHIEAGGRRAYKQPARRKILDGQERWLRERFERHRGSADVVRQELIAKKGLLVSPRARSSGR